MTFASELDPVQTFAPAIDRFPVEALSPGATRLLLVGHETALPGAGKQGSNGSADLLAVDDQGELWVIEAKLARNPECVPLYVFANQLGRYGQSLVQHDFATLHGHLEDYAFGRRAVVPPVGLALAWLEARSLADMLRAWLADWDRSAEAPSAEELVRRIAERARTGNFVLAVLTDQPDPALVRWSRDQAGEWQTAVITAAPDGTIRVPVRSAPRVLTADGAVVSPPAFARVPQSFELLPRTLPYVLNPVAFRLYETVVVPRLCALLGELEGLPVKQSSTSFGYTLPSALGLPLFLRIGRNDARAHDGAAVAEPGQHALKVDVVLKWACDAISLIPAVEVAARQGAIDALWSLTSALVLEAGYKFKNQPRPLPLAALVRQFERGCSARTLLVERARYGQGHAAEFGLDPAHEAADAAALHTVFDILERHLPVERPLRPVPRPPRVPYDEGPLEGCTPSGFRESPPVPGPDF